MAFNTLELIILTYPVAPSVVLRNSVSHALSMHLTFSDRTQGSALTKKGLFVNFYFRIFADILLSYKRSCYSLIAVFILLRISVSGSLFPLTIESKYFPSTAHLLRKSLTATPVLTFLC